MLTPYDWQEGIGHRAQYVESRLAGGTPVVMASVAEGILALTARRQARKIFEIYDRLMFSAIGQQSDVESMRVAAVDFAHQEGYNRSEADVTIQRVVSALGQPLKRAFGDFNTAPFVVRALFAELAESPEADSYYVMDFDGDYTVRSGFAYLAPNEDGALALKTAAAAIDWKTLSIEDALKQLRSVWAKALDPSGARTYEQLTENLSEELAILHRQGNGSRHFELK